MARSSLVLAASLWVFVCAGALLGCRPQGLGEGPPRLAADTPVLAAFDPAALAGPANTGLDLDAALAGPPQPPAPPEPPPLPPPAVVDYGPTAESSVYPTIQIRFNRPIVALGEKQRISAQEAGFTFDPPIPGEAYWAEPTRLVFEPEGPIALATEFQVGFARELVAVDGPTLDVDLRWSFTTQGPDLSVWTDGRDQEQGGREYHWKARVGVRASQEIRLVTLREHVRAQARDPQGALQDVEIRVSAARSDPAGYRDADFWITPKTRWPADTEIVVTIDEDLRGELGPRPVGYPTVHSFRTAAGVEAHERYCVEGEYADGCELGPVVVRLTSPIRRSQARYLKISPEPRGFDALAVDREYEYADEGRGRALDRYQAVMLWGEFALGQTYEISVDPKLRDVHGQPLVGAPSLEVEFVEPPPSLALVHASGTFARDREAKIGVEARHLERLKLRVAVLDDATHERLVASDSVAKAWPSEAKPIVERSLALGHSGKFGWSSQEIDLGETDADGLVALPGATELGDDALVRARKGDDAVLLSVASLWREPAPSDAKLRRGESVRTTLLTERPLYKPGERVRVMGWSSLASPYELSGLRRLPSKTAVDIELRDVRDELVARATVRVKDHGKFWATLTIPETAALGDYTVHATLLGSEFTRRLQVKDFPVPAFEVSAQADASDLHSGESTQIRVDASYYFGGRVPITRARHTTACTEIDYRPPGLDASFSVAPQRESRWGYGRMGRPLIHQPPGPDAGRGHLEYDIQLNTGADGQPQQCTHSVAVADVSEQEIGAEATIWVHPEFYLAAAAPRWLEHGAITTIELRTLDFDGAPIPVDDLEVTLTRRFTEPEYVVEGNKRRFAGWREREQTLAPCKTKSTGAATCSFAKLDHGSYELVAKATRGDYAPQARRRFWVAWPRGAARPSTPSERLAVELDQAKPLVGQTVRATIRAPWSTGSGLLVLDKGGVQDLRGFSLAQGQAQLELEVDDAWIPGVELHAIAVAPGDKATLPSLRTASARVEVGPDSRRLAVRVTAPSEARTGARLPITVEVRDALGQPARGHVSVWAVDEAVLSLAPLNLPDFVEAFVVGFGGALDILGSYAALILPYATRPDPYAPVEFVDGWASDVISDGIGLGSIGLMGHGAGGGSGSGGGAGGGPGMPATRSKFESAPIFIADAELDARGIAELEGELPDNLTTFRLTAVASAPLGAEAGSAAAVEARFGTGDARVRVTRPLVVRAAMPRILRPGDLAEVGVVVDNLRGAAGTVDLDFTVHAGEGVVALLDKPIASAKIEAGGQLRIPFRIQALTTGTPEIEVKAVLRARAGSNAAQAVDGELVADALRLPLPVEPERTLTDRVAVYGSLADDGAALLPFVIPRDADPRFGGLSVSLGSSLLGGVEDAVAYLIKYPYGCLEQTSSALLPLIPLGQLAEDYPLGIDDVDAYVAAGVARLRAMQLPSGGFSYWPGGETPAPYASAYATYVLIRADQAGYPIPPSMLAAAIRYLEAEIAGWEAVTGPALGQDIEAALMLASLAERGAAPDSALAKLYERRQRLPVFSQALLLLALDHADHDDPRIPALTAELKSVVDEREAVAKVELERRWTWYWDTSVRSSALVLLAMLRADPMHPLVPKLTRGLLEARRGGRWSNTQENAYALVALAEYARQYEAEEPRFDGRVWLGNAMLARVHVEGRQFEFEDGFTPMAELLSVADQADERLILERAGQGRMYYRVGLEWASTAADRPAKAEGIRIARTLRGAAGAIAEDQAVQSGDLLAIDVELEVPAALDHVAIEIPLPAGLEAVDLELGKGRAAMKLSGARGRWVAHQELRRDRAVVFADHLNPGVHQTTLFLRATTPGEYLMPAGHAEMMYYPEVYGRTTTRRLIVR